MDPHEKKIFQKIVCRAEILFRLSRESRDDIRGKGAVSKDGADPLDLSPEKVHAIFPVHQPEDPVRAGLEGDMKVGTELFSVPGKHIDETVIDLAGLERGDTNAKVALKGDDVLKKGGKSIALPIGRGIAPSVDAADDNFFHTVFDQGGTFLEDAILCPAAGIPPGKGN